MERRSEFGRLLALGIPNNEIWCIQSKETFEGSAYLNWNDVFKVFLCCNYSSAIKTSNLSKGKFYSNRKQANKKVEMSYCGQVAREVYKVSRVARSAKVNGSWSDGR